MQLVHVRGLLMDIHIKMDTKDLKLELLDQNRMTIQ